MHLLRHLTLTACLFWLMTASAAVSADSDRKADIDFFERRVRPVLLSRCIKCHGPKKQESGLRLDSRGAILKGGDSGPAADVRKPDASLIIEAVRRSADLKMPPDKPLSPNEVDSIVRWVRLGLPWPESARPTASGTVNPESHWAFQPVTRPNVPGVSNRVWPRTKIDHFILSRLEQAQLPPAAEAVVQTLIRRATFDLTGLPPTPHDSTEFQSAFEADPDAACEELVDRLLKSPQYGERQGRHWLDVARYADNKGYVFFEEKNFPWAWTYRDWVIRAFNEDLPYDQFVTQQLAADLLELGDDRNALAAMGFLTLGARFMNNTHDILDDRIDVVTRGLMGLTVTCARCHDHKFDPIPQADYYSLYGIFRSSQEPTLRPLFQPTPDDDQYKEFDKGMQERVAALQKFEDGQRTLIMKGARERVADYLLAVHNKRNHPSTENFMLLADKGGLIPAMVHRWEVYLKRARREDDPVWTLWHRLSDLPSDNFETAAAKIIEDDASAPNANRHIHKALTHAALKSMQEVAQRYGAVFQTINQQWKKQLDEAAGDSSDPDALPDSDAEALRQVLYGTGSPPMIPKQLGWGFLDLIPDRPTQAEFKKLIGEVEKWSRTGPGAPPRAMVLVDSEVAWQPVIFQRGNPNREGRPVPRRVPAVLSRTDREEFTSGSGRLKLAQAIVDPANPLTARVFVNRIWKQHFGMGLVDTPSDFGLRSSPPSHPELLDWLAATFVADGWSVKKLHRRIMLSSVYRQSSDPHPQADPQVFQVDATNRLLWKFPRRRLDFESTRDSLLAVSGSLDSRIGGPPANVLSGFVPRRTVYGFVNRMDLPGVMRSFDFPEPAATSPGRETTTIAPQALYFLNNDFVSECADRLLRRPELKQATTTAKRVDAIHRILFSRDTMQSERALAESFLSAAGQEIPPAAKAWSYGYGGVDEASSRVSSFTALTHWTGSRWQAGPQMPDPKLGWVFHEKNGGHPASSNDRCAIRRWTAPVTGTISITSRMKHHPEPGNGVRGRIISSSSGILGVAKVDHSEADINIADHAIKAGDTIDFVADWQDHITHDEHDWFITIRLTKTNDDSSKPTVTDWDAQRDFVGAGTDAWTKYVHALLMTNEFVFVD